MTAETCNDKGDGKSKKGDGESKAKADPPAGMTTKKSKNAKQKANSAGEGAFPILSPFFPYCFPTAFTIVFP
jgi:hypothetical protein